MVQREIVRMAAKAEYTARRETFFRWQREGHVTIVEDGDPHFISAQVDSEIFREPRETFPTTGLIAKLGLAIAAGQSDRNRTAHMEDYQVAAFRYSRIFNRKGSRHYWLDEAHALNNDNIFHNSTLADRIAVTAKVTKKKGLRP